MLHFYPNEVFKEFLHGDKQVLHYAVSNFGRIISYKDTPENGTFIKGNNVNGYRLFRWNVKTAENKRKTKHLFIYKLVAELFIPKISEDHIHVIHIDHNRSNDFAGNLKWVTKAEANEHYKKSPFVISAKNKLVEHNRKSDGQKLTVTQVIFLKKKLLDPNRKTRLKLLAKQFGVSHMTLHRIKTGENWSHIKV